ncbi:hypothetical protein [Saccharopolyspora sp. NPDC002376]
MTSITDSSPASSCSRRTEWASKWPLTASTTPHVARTGARRPRSTDNWFDEIAVERALRQREPVGRPLTWAEKKAVAVRLLTDGASANEIARRTRSNGTTLHRLLADIERTH